MTWKLNRTSYRNSGEEGNEHSVTTLIMSNFIPIIIVLYLSQITYYLFFHPLHKVPGPFLARFSKLWRTIRYFRGSWLDDIVDLHKQYGPIARIAPNEVSFVDEYALKQLYGHGKPSLKTSWYDTWRAPNQSISFFASTDVKEHRHLRSRVSAVYSMSSMLSFEPLVQQVLDTNWNKFKEFAKKDKPVDLSVLVSYFTFDIVSQLSFGGMLGFIEKQEDVMGLIKSIHDGFYLMSNMGDTPGKMWIFNNAVSQHMIRKYGSKELNSMNYFGNWLKERVEERMANGLEEGRNPDMLQYFIEAKNQQGQPLTVEDVMAEAGNVIGAGADTTTVAILATIGQILKNPSVYKKLQEEIDNAYTNLRLAEDDEISFKETEKLPYLSAVIKESMRLHPSIPYQLPRLLPEQGLSIKGYHLPKSVVCGISPAAMNRSTELFGKDAYSFRPERWILVEDSETERKRLRVMDANLTTFGMGSRSCVGRNLSLVEVHKFVAQFMRHFDADLINSEKPWVTKTQWFALQKEFWVTLRERK